MNKKIVKLKYFILATSYLLIAAWFFGCATAPRKPTLKIPAALESKSFRIGKIKYIYLKDFCQSYDLVWDWDTLGKRITLYREGIRIDLAVGSEFILVSSKIVNLESPVKIFNNEPALPFILSEKVAYLLLPSLPYKIAKPQVAGIYKIKRIVIDPGHGGRDPGAVGPGGLREKDVVLDMAKDLKAYLECQGIEVMLTRSDDKFVSLWRRAHLANMKKADLFISIHANSSRWEQAKGFEVYYLSEKMEDSTRALAKAENAVLELEGENFSTSNTALAATLWDLIQTENRAEAIKLSSYIGNAVDRLSWIENRGVKGALFYVLKGANMPAILVETGFISNRSEGKKLDNQLYRKELIRAIGQGILDYKDEYEQTDGFTR